MNLHAWPGDANLLDQEAYEFLTLFEVEGVDACSNAPGERVNLCRQPVADGEFLVLRQECVSFLLELSMAAGHLVLPSLELSEVDCLHLIQVHEPPSFGLCAL